MAALENVPMEAMSVSWAINPLLRNPSVCLG
jgi:hypothetical protein